jgi:hypothetical protein
MLAPNDSTVMNDEEKKTWKEAVVSYGKTSPLHLTKGTEVNHDDSGFPK